MTANGVGSRVSSSFPRLCCPPSSFPAPMPRPQRPPSGHCTARPRRTASFSGRYQKPVGVCSARRQSTSHTARKGTRVAARTTAATMLRQSALRLRPVRTSMSRSLRGFADEASSSAGGTAGGAASATAAGEARAGSSGQPSSSGTLGIVRRVNDDDEKSHFGAGSREPTVQRRRRVPDELLRQSRLSPP